MCPRAWTGLVVSFIWSRGGPGSSNGRWHTLDACKKAESGGDCLERQGSLSMFRSVIEEGEDEQ